MRLGGRFCRVDLLTQPSSFLGAPSDSEKLITVEDSITITL